MAIWSHAALAEAPTLPYLDLAPDLNRHAGDVSMDRNSCWSSASSWARRLPTVAAAALVGLVANPTLTLARELFVAMSDGSSQFVSQPPFAQYFLPRG
jgi:hypothetical protein